MNRIHRLNSPVRQVKFSAEIREESQEARSVALQLHSTPDLDGEELLLYAAAVTLSAAQLKGVERGAIIQRLEQEVRAEGLRDDTVALCYRALGFLYQAGDASPEAGGKAIVAFRQAASKYRAMEEYGALVEVLLDLANALDVQSSKDTRVSRQEALETYEEALGHIAPTESPDVWAVCQMNMSVALRNHGESEAADQALKRAASVFAIRGMPPIRSWQMMTATYFSADEQRSKWLSQAWRWVQRRFSHREIRDLRSLLVWLSSSADLPSPPTHMLNISAKTIRDAVEAARSLPDGARLEDQLWYHETCAALAEMGRIAAGDVQAECRTRRLLLDCLQANKPFALYLRSFGVEAKEGVIADLGAAVFLRLENKQIEEKIAQIVGTSPVFAPRHPLAFGKVWALPRLTLPEASWQTAVRLLSSAAVLRFCLIEEMSAGIREEIRILRSLPHGQTVFILAPQIEFDPPFLQPKRAPVWVDRAALGYALADAGVVIYQEDLLKQDAAKLSRRIARQRGRPDSQRRRPRRRKRA